MAELLERRLLRLKNKLEGLRRLYSNKDRPLAVDLEMQVIEELIRHLDTGGFDTEHYH